MRNTGSCGCQQFFCDLDHSGCPEIGIKLLKSWIMSFMYRGYPAKSPFLVLVLAAFFRPAGAQVCDSFSQGG